MKAGPSPRWRIAGHLLRSGLITPRALLRLIQAVARDGANVLALARLGGNLGPGGIIADGEGHTSYPTLADEAYRIATVLQAEHGAGRGTAVAIAGPNNLAFARALLAVSRLGADAVLLNPGLPAPQMQALLARQGVALVLATDDTVSQGLGPLVLRPDTLLQAAPPAGLRLPRRRSGQIVVLTGGSTGLPKAAARKAEAAGVMRLFLHLVTALRLEQRQSAFIAVPLFHGFGLATLIVAIALGKTVHLRQRFDAAEALGLIAAERIDTLVVVPTMLRRMLAGGQHAGSVRCIVSGGAMLEASLARDARAVYGDILFNLYGTSEAGLSVLATPADLHQAPGTIGRPLWGVEITIDPRSETGIGELRVRNPASVQPGEWVATGDLATCDDEGRWFVRGRVDDMIVSGGENVGPWELEDIVSAHAGIAEAVAVGAPDSEYGQRLVLFFVARKGADVTPESLAEWLKIHAARHQVPRQIFRRAALPLTAIGKVDRMALRREVAFLQDLPAGQPITTRKEHG